MTTSTQRRSRNAARHGSTLAVGGLVAALALPACGPVVAAASASGTTSGWVTRMDIR